MSEIAKSDVQETDINNLDISKESALTKRTHLTEGGNGLVIYGIDVDPDIALEVVKLRHHPKFDDIVATNLPTINLPQLYRLYINDILTYPTVATQSVDHLVECLSISEALAECIRATARNRTGSDMSLAVSVSTRTGASEDEVTQVYDELVSNSFTSYEKTRRENVEDFLVNYLGAEETTSIYALKVCNPDFVRLLVSKGYKTVHDILQEDANSGISTPLGEIEYFDIFGDDSTTIAPDRVDILQRISECKIKRAEMETVDSDLAVPTLNEVTMMLEDSNANYEKSLPDRRIATTAVETGLAFRWSQRVMNDAIEFFSHAKDAEITIGGGIERSFAACLRLASVLNGEPSPYDELAEIVNEDKQSIRSKLNRIVTETPVSDLVEMEDMIVDPVECVPYIQQNLPDEIPEHVFDKVQSRLRTVDTNSTSPWTEAASATYAVLKELDNQTYTQDMIGDVVSLSTVSLRNNYSKYRGDKFNHIHSSISAKTND